MSWKDYLYFTKKERIGLLSFCLIILLVFTYRFFSPRRAPVGEDIPTDSLAAPTPVAAETSPAFSKGRGRQTSTAPTRYRKKTYVLHKFDPNVADSLTLIGLGLRPYVVRNMLKYRSKGGRFRKPEDLARVYGLSNEQFEEIRPYIQITAASPPAKATVAPVLKKDSLPSEDQRLDTGRVVSFARQEKYPAGVTIDVNAADTAEWKKIPGIGSVFARRIVKYRQLLGGYHSVEQIGEVYGLSPERYDQIKPWLRPVAGSPAKLAANSLSLDRLKAHPYINFYQAKAIVELRKKKRLTALSDLQLLEEFTAGDLQRLAPYLSFD